MRRALLDTDIFSEVAKGKNEFVRRRALTYMSTVGPLAISTVTVVEVVKGFRKVGREQGIARFLASLPKLEVFALDTVAAEHAGRIYGDLERVGEQIGDLSGYLSARRLALFNWWLSASRISWSTC